MARAPFLKGRDVIDSTYDFGINIRARDVKGAAPRDGVDCVAGRCILRSQDAAVVYVYRSVTYIAWDDDGPIVRFKNSARLVRNVIEILDDPKRKNSEIVPGVYILKAVPVTQRLGRDRTAKKPGTRGPRVDRGHRVMGRVTAAKRRFA